MKTSQIISDYRAAYKLHSDDTVWTDRYLVSIANIARAKLLHQKAKRNKLKRTNYVSFCLPLCLGKPVECPCIAEGQCYALVSKYNLPDFININGAGLEVRVGNGSKLDIVSPRDASLQKLNPALKDKLSYWIENYRGQNKLVIWHSLDLSHVYVSMIPVNIDDIAAIAVCDDTEVSTADCDSWTNEEFPLDAELLFDLYQLMNNLLIANLRDADDDVNDTTDKLEK